MSSKRPTVVLSTLLVGIGAGFVGAIVSARRHPAAPPPPPIGRVGEPGRRWTVEESVLIHRPAGEIAAHLHDHGGLPGLSGDLDGPAMDKVEWDVDGTGHLEAEVHGLPGADRTQVTVRVSPEHEGVSGVAQAATSAVFGSSVRARVKSDLDALRRTLEGGPSAATPRATSSGAATGQER